MKRLLSPQERQLSHSFTMLGDPFTADWTRRWAIAFPHVTNSSGLPTHVAKLSTKRAYAAEASIFGDHCTRGTIAAAASTTSGFVEVSSIQRMGDDPSNTMMGVEVDLNRQ